MTYVNLHSKGFNKEDEDCLYINVFVPLVITSVADTCRPASNCIENSSLWKKDIYALNHYFLKERPHLSKNDDAMLIMTVFNLYSLLAITIFFWKPLPYFTSNEQLTDEALEQCINIFFFKGNCSQLLAGRHVSNKEVIFGDSVLCVMLKYMYHKNQSMQFIRGKKVNVFIARWTLTLDCRNLFLRTRI